MFLRPAFGCLLLLGPRSPLRSAPRLRPRIAQEASWQLQPHCPLSVPNSSCRLQMLLPLLHTLLPSSPAWLQGPASGAPSCFHSSPMIRGFPGGSGSKEPACNAGDMGSIPGSGRFPEEGNGNPLQYSCLENSTDGGAWWTMHSMG